MIRLTSVRIAGEEDVVFARQRARQIAAALGLALPAQTRLAVAVTEVACNAANYAGGGTVTFTVNRKGSTLDVTVADRGPGIPHLDLVLNGTYRSATGTGLGITGARALVDRFHIHSEPGGGTTVVMRQRLPARRGSAEPFDFSSLAKRLASEKPLSPVREVLEQNRELLLAFEELRRNDQQAAVAAARALDAERVAQALSAELEDKSKQLRRAEELKATFLSTVAHELQTPLNSVGALSRMLLEGQGRALSSEQRMQVEFIRQATRDLSDLVNDLLESAKADAGKSALRPSRFTVPELFGALRGLMRPLQSGTAVSLEFATGHLPALFTDEGKLSQVLRNYISNALKFTERGEVRVTAEAAGGDEIVFRVSDTGIGIPPGEQGLLFQDFQQLPNPLQRRVRGTGLGLSVCRRLAEVLGGSVGAESEPGRGSTFWIRVPVVAPGHEPPAEPPGPPEVERPVVLVVDDDERARYVLRYALTSAGCRVIEAHGGQEGIAVALSEQPDAVFLDLHMADMPGTETLARLKRNTVTSHIPIVICTSQPVDAAERERLSAHVAAVLPKACLSDPGGIQQIRDAFRAANIQLQSPG